MENAIIFAGCSYTFGEGLELYVDTPKWINQRNYITNDPELKAVWDKDGQDFRLNNNFPSIVAKHFKSTPYQDSNNGGSFASSTRYIKKAQRIIDDLINKTQPDHIYCQLIRVTEYVRKKKMPRQTRRRRTILLEWLSALLFNLPPTRRLLFASS